MAEYKVVDATKLDADLASVADAIRTKGGTSESLEFPQGFVDAVNAIESGGGGEDDYYKNIIQEALYNYEGSSNYHRISIFAGTSIEDVSMFDFSKVKTFAYAFRNSNIKELELDLSNASGDLAYLCGYCPNLTKVILRNMSSAYTSGTSMFGDNKALEIVKTIDFSGFKTFGNSLTYQPFSGCTALKEVRFVENCIKSSISFIWCSQLSNESIQSIIDGLAYVTTAQTLTLYADVKAKLTETQLATITSKNWNLA